MEFIWAISEYCDSVKRRRKKVFEAEERRQARYGWKPTRTFGTETEAWAFAVGRAAARVAKAEDALKSERLRLKKCEKRLASLLEPEAGE